MFTGITKIEEGLHVKVKSEMHAFHLGYKNSKSSAGRRLTEIRVHQRVREECWILPMLFNIYVNHIPRERKGMVNSGERWVCWHLYEFSTICR